MLRILQISKYSLLELTHASILFKNIKYKTGMPYEFTRVSLFLLVFLPGCYWNLHIKWLIKLYEDNILKNLVKNSQNIKGNKVSY